MLLFNFVVYDSYLLLSSSHERRKRDELHNRSLALLPLLLLILNCARWDIYTARLAITHLLACGKTKHSFEQPQACKRTVSGAIVGPNYKLVATAFPSHARLDTVLIRRQDAPPWRTALVPGYNTIVALIEWSVITTTTTTKCISPINTPRLAMSFAQTRGLPTDPFERPRICTRMRRTLLSIRLCCKIAYLR